MPTVGKSNFSRKISWNGKKWRKLGLLWGRRQGQTLQKWAEQASLCHAFLLAPLQTLPVFAKVWKSVGIFQGRLMPNQKYNTEFRSIDTLRQMRPCGQVMFRKISKACSLPSRGTKMMTYVENDPRGCVGGESTPRITTGRVGVESVQRNRYMKTTRSHCWKCFAKWQER